MFGRDELKMAFESRMHHVPRTWLRSTWYVLDSNVAINLSCLLRCHGQAIYAYSICSTDGHTCVHIHTYMHTYIDEQTHRYIRPYTHIRRNTCVQDTSARIVVSSLRLQHYVKARLCTYAQIHMVWPWQGVVRDKLNGPFRFKNSSRATQLSLPHVIRSWLGKTLSIHLREILSWLGYICVQQMYTYVPAGKYTDVHVYARMHTYIHLCAR